MTFVLLPFVVLSLGMVLLAAVLALGSHGPLGWLAAAGLLAALWSGGRWTWRAGCRWWASTKAPEIF